MSIDLLDFTIDQTTQILLLMNGVTGLLTRMIIVRKGKGGKDRVVMLPQSLLASFGSEWLIQERVGKPVFQRRMTAVELRVDVEEDFPPERGRPVPAIMKS